MADSEQSQETETYELTPEQATGFEAGPEGPGVFNRKRVLMALSIAFVLVIGGGLLLNTINGKKKTKAQDSAVSAARSPSEFLRSLRDRAGKSADAPGADSQSESAQKAELPAVSFESGPSANEPRPYAGTVPTSREAPVPPPQARGAAPAASGGADAGSPAYRSALVPRDIAGSLFGANTGAAGQGSGTYAEQYPYRQNGQAQSQNALDEYLRRAAGAAAAPAAYGADPYTLQNDQQGKQQFYAADGGGAVTGGRFLGDNAVWIGTIVPGVLETAVNTDLPGDVLARVTRHVYDSRTGLRLLIPQGTLLIARYNSSVSYAQHRVQIVWDTLIRPDGFQIDLGGMNGVDKQGISGQQAVYHENWFEYLKAAGIITMFSLANARMTEEAAKYASTAASGVAQANGEMVNQLGGGIVSRAMNIQPTLTVDNGTLINIMLNKTLYLPPVE